MAEDAESVTDEPAYRNDPCGFGVTRGPQPGTPRKRSGHGHSDDGQERVVFEAEPRPLQQRAEGGRSLGHASCSRCSLPRRTGSGTSMGYSPLKQAEQNSPAGRPVEAIRSSSGR